MKSNALARAVDQEIGRCQKRLDTITPKARAIVGEIKDLKARIEHLESVKASVAAVPAPAPHPDAVDPPAPVRDARGEQILNLLRIEDRWMSPKAIAEELGGGVPEIRHALSALLDAGKIVARGSTVDRAYLIVRDDQDQDAA